MAFKLRRNNDLLRTMGISPVHGEGFDIETQKALLESYDPSREFPVTEDNFYKDTVSRLAVRSMSMSTMVPRRTTIHNVDSGEAEVATVGSPSPSKKRKLYNFAALCSETSKYPIVKTILKTHGVKPCQGELHSQEVVDALVDSEIVRVLTNEK